MNFSFDEVTVINYVVGVLIPVVTAFVTSKVSSSKFKALFSLTTAAVASVLTAAAASGGFDLDTFFPMFFTTWTTAILVHYGLLKPTGVSGSDGVIQVAVPGGLGAGTAGNETNLVDDAEIEEVDDEAVYVDAEGQDEEVVAEAGANE